VNRVTITLTIDLPDGVVPDVGYATVEPVFTAKAEPPDFRTTGTAEEPPDLFPPMTPLNPPSAPLCQHGIPMKRYPAGVSKSTGKSYNASWRPSDANCTTKAIWDKDPVAA
jgi:hypothetical protein